MTRKVSENSKYFKYDYILNNIYKQQFPIIPGKVVQKNWYTIYKDQLNNDPVFKLILQSGIEICNVYPGNWKSMCMNSRPSDIRLRPAGEEEFLNNCIQFKLNKTLIVFSCIKIDDVKVYFICSSNHFSEYFHKPDVGNSFIRMDISELESFKEEPNQIRNHTRRVKNKGDQSIYQFWTGTDKDTNYSSLLAYVQILTKIQSCNYAVLNRINIPTRKSIPNSIRTKVCDLWNNKCSLTFINKCLRQNNIDFDIEIHHVVPWQWFLENKYIDNNIANNINNLVPLCRPCHDKMSDKQETEKRKYLGYLIESLKENHKINDFEDYIFNVLHITYPILYKIYGVEYNGQ